MCKSWVRWGSLLLVVASALTSIESEPADGTPRHAVGWLHANRLPSPLESVHCSSTEDCLAMDSNSPQ